MLPRYHFLTGLILVVLVWFSVPDMPYLYLGLILFGAFLIDFDHYVASVMKTKKPRLKDSFEYHRKLEIIEKKEITKGIRRKGDFHLFHTVEFHVLVGLLGIFWSGFFYIFIGMLFHTLIDLFSLLLTGALHKREYFFFNWVNRKLKQS